MVMSVKNNSVLAFDFGASSGRAMLGHFDGKTIELEEVHRFSNDPVNVNGTLYWDILRLFHEIKQGVIKAQAMGGFSSIGIDTWGVDFGLIDKDGRLLENPVHYRDKRTNGMIEDSFRLIPKEKFYELTGNQFLSINTVFQVLSLVQNRSDFLSTADKLLMTPDLFSFMLTGEKKTEYSIATTTQMLDPYKKTWSHELLSALSIPSSLLTEVIPSGSVYGKLSKEISEELCVPQVDVISVASHDTASAVVAVPATNKDFIFISCGTWSLFGTELDSPIINKTSQQLDLTNEGGYNGTTTFLKNIIGLWMIQESRRQWQRESKDYSYAELEHLALETEPFKCFINPDAPEFVPQGNIPKRIQQFCQRTGQYVPQTVGEIMRCIYQSLAMKYRSAFDQIRECTGKSYANIHIVGGGVKDNLLCKMTSSSCGCAVIAGPIEATVLGNIAVQLISSRAISDITEARKIIANSQSVIEYQPTDADKWNEVYIKNSNIINKE